MCSDPAAKGVDGVIQGLRTVMTVTVAWVCHAIQRLFAVCLAQQGVEAVVEAGTEAEVGRIGGTVQGVFVVFSWHGERMLVLVVVGGLVEVVLLE